MALNNSDKEALCRVMGRQRVETYANLPSHVALPDAEVGAGVSLPNTHSLLDDSTSGKPLYEKPANEKKKFPFI